ncbi:MAG: hypothetical protein J6S41_05875 [Clostridia bacterium]|nr:hypothetical protein [Clostridia bacterium]
MNEIERIKKHLERAYANVSKLKVSGDAVDAVYEVREELRMAFRIAERMEQERKTQEVKADAAAENEVQLPDREDDAG